MRDVLRNCNIYTDENNNASSVELEDGSNVVAAFQSWHGGKSGLFLTSIDGEETVANWLLEARNSGTFAQTHVFTCESEAISYYNYEDD